MADAATDLAAALLRRIREVGMAGTTTGTVSLTSPLTVTVAGTDMVMGRLSSYTPAVGDVVLVLTSSTTRWTALGKVLAP